MAKLDKTQKEILIFLYSFFTSSAFFNGSFRIGLKRLYDNVLTATESDLKILLGHGYIKYDQRIVEMTPKGMVSAYRVFRLYRLLSPIRAISFYLRGIFIFIKIFFQVLGREFKNGSKRNVIKTVSLKDVDLGGESNSQLPPTTKVGGLKE